MRIPFLKEVKIGSYILKQKMRGNKRYPLVLMLEPLFRCNLACSGCGKIDYPGAILNQRLSVKECLDAVDECGAPVVAIPGGEPLIHKEIGEIVEGIVARKKFVSLCTNALLLEKKLHLFKPSPYLTITVHLDGLKTQHDRAVSQDGVFDVAVQAIKAAKAAGHNVNVNATIFDNQTAEEIAGVPRFCEDARYRRQHLPRLRLRARARSAALPGPPQHQGTVPPRVRARQGQELDAGAFAALSRLPRRQSGISLHAVGDADPQRVRLAEALLLWSAKATSPASRS